MSIIQNSYNFDTYWIPQKCLREGSNVYNIGNLFLELYSFLADCLYLYNFQIVVVDNSGLAITERSSY